MREGDYVRTWWRVFRRNPRAVIRMSYTFDHRHVPDDESEREIWSAVGEGEYLTERNMAWVLAYFAIPLFGILVIFVLFLAISRGGIEWLVFVWSLGLLVGARWWARSWKRRAAGVRSALDQHAGD